MNTLKTSLVLVAVIVTAYALQGWSVHSYKNTSNPANAIDNSVNTSAIFQYMYVTSVSQCPFGTDYYSRGKSCIEDGVTFRGWTVYQGNTTYVKNITIIGSDEDVSCFGSYCNTNNLARVFYKRNQTSDWRFVGSVINNDANKVKYSLPVYDTVYQILIARSAGGSARPDPVVYDVGFE